MTKAVYKDLNVNVDAFLNTFRTFVNKAGWQIKDEISDRVTATFTIKKGLLNTATVKARGTSQDLFVELIGTSAVMDLVEQAVAASCDKPTSIIGWRDQMSLRPPVQSQTASQPTPTTQPSPSISPPQPIIKPTVPKLEACLHCGAPVTYNPEEYLIICEYCGFINNPSGEQPPRYSMLPICFAGTKIIDIAKNHVAKGIFITKNMANQAEWGTIILRYVPNWTMTIQLRGSLQGDRALIKTKDAKSQVAQNLAMNALSSILAGASQGKSSGRNIQQHRSVTHSINEALDVFVVARRGAAFQPDVGVQKIPLDKKEPFQKVSDETLNVELSPAEALEKARGLALDDVRARYLSVSNFNVTATPVGDPELIYTPWWFLEYKMGGVSYSLIVDACVGNVIAGKRPWLPKKTAEKKEEVTTVA
jgi:hypothetical protein